jgi:ATP-dependent DNA ligase
MQFEDYKPMLANPVDIDKVGKYGNYTMEVKLDGVRCIAIKDPTGHVSLWSRSGKELTHKLDHIRVQLQGIKGSFVIDGELGYCNESLIDEATRSAFPVCIDFNATMRVLGSSPTTAEAKQIASIANGWQPIKFIVFDILQKGNYPATRLVQEERREGLADLLHNLATDPLYDIELSKDWPAWDEKLYTDIVSNGGEGVMLKNPFAQYHIGKRRANTWYKVKAFDTVDCRIVDAVLGQGKYENQIGALVVEDPTGKRVKVSGMTDDQRLDMTARFGSRYVTKMCEVRFFGKVGENKDGYRHPQFLRMRPDLDTP